MPRRRRPEPREILPDPVYNSTLAEKFVNSMMWDGKKNTSQRIFYVAMDKIRERTADDPLKLFKKAIENAKPLLEVKTRRVGGANYQVPVEVPQNRRVSLTIRWILINARGSPVTSNPEQLSNEPSAAANQRVEAFMKNDAYLRMRSSDPMCSEDA